MRNIDNETLLEFAVVTIPSKNLATATISDYSLELAKRWGIGKKELNNGILIALCREKRVIQIQIGYGIETIWYPKMGWQSSLTPFCYLKNFL